MIPIVIIVSPVLIFVLYFIFLVLLVFFYICFFFYTCIFFLHLSFFSIVVYFFYTCLFFYTCSFPGVGVCVFRVLGLAFFCWSCFSSLFVLLVVFVFDVGLGLGSGCSCLGACFSCGACWLWSGPYSMFWFDGLGWTRRTCLERDGHDWRVVFS